MDPDASAVTREVDEMVAAWRRGERPLAEDILARHPELGDDAAIRLIYEEVCARQEAGEEVDPAEVARRFPQWRDELVLLLDCQRLMESAPARVEFPHVGEPLGGFRLIAELGRGAAGRVFLAAQPTLGDRPVVVKVTPRGREEHLSLARLQHMNIVPLYSEHVLRDRNLQLLCMPYLGGATMAQILDALEDRPVAERTGRQIVEVLDRIQARHPTGLQAAGPYRRFIARASYVEAVCTIGAALADGLHYAHERDLVHMDVKPSNALLAGDGQPMLLDFHLARSPIVPDSPPPAWMGGTLEFMSPEHRRAMDAVREGRPVRDPVDGRTDIYSLGMLLYVALGGIVPESGNAALVPLHRLNPRVSIGLADVIQHCLARHPDDRYADAVSLADDLRRQLSDRPLRGVPNRSWPERWRKWRRRNPWGLSRRGLIGLILLAAIGAPASTLGIAYRQRIDTVAAAMDLGRASFEAHEYAESASTFRQGLALVEGLPGFDRHRSELTKWLDRASRAGRAAALHELAETIRFRYGLSPPPAEDAPALVRLGRETWDARGSLLQQPDPETTARVRSDLRDLVVLWADLRVRYASPDELPRARQEAAEIIAAAADFLGTSPSLERDRSTYSGAKASGDAVPDLSSAPRSAWEHYDLGRSYLRSNQPVLAAAQFRRGLESRPQDFWLNFYEGLCDYRLGQFDGAVSAFRVCIALAPESAECYYNRARAYQALDHLDRAVADYDRALSLSPRLTDAAVNRGIIRFRQGQCEVAISDLERALKTTSSRSALGNIRYNLALVHQARGDRQAAARSARAAIELGNHDARELVRRLERPEATKSSQPNGRDREIGRSEPD
jgi:serine/threonine protein kinase/Flp pilus assembly protein TadD